MAKNILYTEYNITKDGEFAKTNTTLLRYPYIYFLATGKLYRLNVVSKVGELYATIQNSGSVSGYSHTNKGDYIYYTSFSSGTLSVKRLNVDTLAVETIIPYIWSSGSDRIYSVEKTNFDVREDGVYIYSNIAVTTQSVISNIVIGTSKDVVYKVYRYSDSLTSLSSINGDPGSDYGTSSSIPRVVNELDRLVYGMNSYSFPTDVSTLTIYPVVGFTNIYRRLPKNTLDSGNYYNCGLFEFEGSYWAVGGSLDGVPNTNIIRIDKTSLRSTIASTYENQSTDEPAVAVSDGFVYILFNSSNMLVLSTEEYNIDYTLYNYKGEEAKLLNQLPVKDLVLSYDGVTVNVNLTFIDGTSNNLYIDNKLENDMLFAGLSTKPNAKRPTIIIGNNAIKLYSNTSFYPVIVKQLNPETVFAVNLYKNSAEANRVDKTNYLTAVGSLNGVMREGSSITDLSITFEMDTLPQFNYVHIPAFNRYYYVNDISSVKYRLWEMRLSVDVLMTYNDKIRALTAFVSRNQNTYNPDIVDNCIPILQGKQIQIITAEDTIFDEFSIDEYALSIVDRPCRIAFVGTGIGLGSEIPPNQTE